MLSVIFVSQIELREFRKLFNYYILYFINSTMCATPSFVMPRTFSILLPSQARNRLVSLLSNGVKTKVFVPLSDEKNLFAPQGTKYALFDPLVEKKFILRVKNLMPEQSKDNNRTSKINVFLMLHKIFFSTGGSMNRFVLKNIW